MSFPRPERSSKPGGRTLYVPTTPGLNVAALDDVDAVARRVASFATNTATPFKRRPLAGGGAAAAGRAARDPAAALASPAASLQVAARAAALRGRFRGEAGREELGRAILDLASAGPGFYLYGKFVDRGLDGVEACWGEDATLHGPPTPSGSQRGGSGAAAAAAAVGAVPQQRRLSADVACASVDAAAHPLAPLPEAASSSSVAAAGPHLPPLHPASAAAAAYPGWPRSPGRGVNGGGGGDGALPPPSPHERRQRHAARRAHFAALACDEALVGLALVRAAPQLFTPGQQVAALAVASFGCAPAFFGGSWADGALAGALGGAVALLGCAASHTTGDRLARAYEFLAAVLCAFVARFVDGLVAHMCYSAVVLSALIWLVQGWTMTNAVVEIATRVRAWAGRGVPQHIGVVTLESTRPASRRTPCPAPPTCCKESSSPRVRCAEPRIGGQGRDVGVSRLLPGPPAFLIPARSARLRPGHGLRACGWSGRAHT